MRNRFFLAALVALLASGSAFSQAKLDARAALFADASRTQSRATGVGVEVAAQDEANARYAVLVELNDASAVELIEELGATVINVRAGIALILTEASALEAIAELDGVKSVSMGSENKPMLDVARATTGVDAVHAGTGLDAAYTGEGVICGLMDTGLDPNHINFLDADGNPRVTRLWTITGSNSAVQTYSTPTAISGFTTDLSSMTHGTHVLGLMAGGYKGKLQQYFINANGSQQNSTIRGNMYYGVAPDAELAVNCGTLDGNNILVAAENILKYAKEKGKPAVANFSLGHNTGPHDGTTASNKYLAELGKEMIICFSAGNEAGTPISLAKNFTASDNIVRTCAGNTTAASAAVDIWGGDATPFKVTFAAVDKTTGAISYSYTLDKTISTAEDRVYLTGSYYTVSTYIKDPAFEAAFGAKGAVLFTSAGVNANNNRYNVTVNVQTQSGTNSNVVPAIFVEGQAGKRVELYTSYGLLSNGLSGYMQGDDSMSINDLACGENLLSVGAYTNRESWACQGGPLGYRNSVAGNIASFSSYGVVNGKNLPDIAGPGEAIIASYNAYYVESKNMTGLTATYTGAKRKSYWAEMSGTSMSSPFVAGVMALWLQADPTLTINEVKDVLRATAIKDEYTAAAPHRFGYGKIDALAGIKYIKSLGAVNDVTTDTNVLISEVARGCYDIYAPGAANISAALYALNGAVAAATEAMGDNASISADGLSAGVYILRVKAGDTTETRKVVVR